MPGRHRLASLLIALLPLPACGKFEHVTGVEALTARRLVARKHVVAVEGGIVAPAAATDLFGMVSLDIPAGALDSDQDVEIWARFGDPRLPSVVQSFELTPAGLGLALPATLRLEYAAAYELTAGAIWAESDLAVWEFESDPSIDLRVCPVRSRDLENNRVTAVIDRLGAVFCMHRELRSLALQAPRLVDPREPVRTEILGSAPVESAEGKGSVRVGKGSLDDFFVSGADRNLLVVPGGYGEALHVVGNEGMFPADVAAGLNADFANIVVFQYPAGHSIRTNGNRLFDAVMSHAQSGFGCNVLAHGGGGLVARWALERALGDTTREGRQPTDASLADLVDRAVFLGTPNDGAPVIAMRFDSIFGALQTRDARFIQGLADLIPTPGGILDVINAGRAPSSTRYFTIAGDVAGGRNDGLVAVSSAIGTESDGLDAESHLVFTGPAYDHFALLALARRTGVADQARNWFGKSRGNSRPIVAELISPAAATGGVIEIPYSLVDADSDVCIIAALYSLDGGAWSIATPADGNGYLQSRNSLPAPGLNHSYFWNTVADGIGVSGVDRVVFRVVASDGGGYGIVGESGWFEVWN